MCDCVFGIHGKKVQRSLLVCVARQTRKSFSLEFAGTVANRRIILNMWAHGGPSRHLVEITMGLIMMVRMSEQNDIHSII